MKMFRCILILLSLMVFSVSFVSAKPALVCPTGPISSSYGFDWQADGYSLVSLQIGYDSGFSSGTFTSLIVNQDPMPINKNYDQIMRSAQLKSSGKLYARVYGIKRFGSEYSNVCVFSLSNVNILDKNDWIVDGNSISGTGLLSDYSLKFPLFSSSPTEVYVRSDLYGTKIFGMSPPFNLDGAKISAVITTPSNCAGSSNGQNYMQLHLRTTGGSTIYVGNTILFSSPGLKIISEQLPTGMGDIVGAFLIKIGTKGSCNGNFYIDNFKIEKNGMIAIYNFE